MYETSRWYLVQCKPKESFRAEQHLLNQNYICFHPTVPVKRKTTQGVKSIIAPLFPHYLFVKLSDTDNWSRIHSTRGVSRIVRFNGVPASLDDHLVEGLRRHCARLNGEFVEPIYKIGDRVIVTEGCFKELEAIVTATDGDERVVLLLNLFNRPQNVMLSIDSVEALECA